MAIKDPTAWMEDLTVHVDDEDMAAMAAQMESSATFNGPRAPVGVWVAVAGTLGGAFGSITLSPDIRASVPAFVVYLAGALILMRGMRPVTNRLLDPGVAWLAVGTLFWTSLLGALVAISGRVGSPVLAYGLSIGIGLVTGMVYGSLNPDFIKREDAWMMTAFPLFPAAAALGTAMLRGPFGRSGSALDMAIAGGLAGAVLMVPMSILLVRLWDQAQALYRIGLLFLHNENYAPKAVAYFDRALALTPDDARLWNLRGIAWSRMGEAERARADWAKVIELTPDDPEPHLNRGTDALRHGEIDLAIACFRKVIELEPEHATAYSNLGAALERRDDLAASIEAYSRAIEIHPEYVNALSNRGYSWFRMGEHDRAIADCNRAIELEPSFANAYVNRGNAYAAKGDPAAARADYQTAIELEPDPVIVEEAMRGLEQLGHDSHETA